MALHHMKKLVDEICRLARLTSSARKNAWSRFVQASDYFFAFSNFILDWHLYLLLGVKFAAMVARERQAQQNAQNPRRAAGVKPAVGSVDHQNQPELEFHPST